MTKEELAKIVYTAVADASREVCTFDDLELDSSITDNLLGLSITDNPLDQMLSTFPMSIYSVALIDILSKVLDIKE